MNLKNSGLVLLLIIFLLPIYKIALAAASTGTTSTPTESNIGPKQVTEIEKIVGKNTPDFLAKPIIAIANFLEGLREKIGIKNQIIFYAILLVIFILILRSLFRLIF